MTAADRSGPWWVGVEILQSCCPMKLRPLLRNSQFCFTYMPLSCQRWLLLGSSRSGLDAQCLTPPRYINSIMSVTILFACWEKTKQNKKTQFSKCRDMVQSFQILNLLYFMILIKDINPTIQLTSELQT